MSIWDGEPMNERIAKCASCPFEVADRLCISGGGKAPSACPTRDYALVEEVRDLYTDPDLREFARQASIQEGEGYQDRRRDNDCPRPCKPRLLETAEFASRMGFSRLGLVFCVGLREEAGRVSSFLEDYGFEVVSVVCKAGRIPKEEIGVMDDEKIRPGNPEPMCNPVMQAMVLNRAGTDFNVVMGLCVGHDSVFLRHSDAYCTVLAAKDRPTGHNPLAAVYTLDSYHRYLEKACVPTKNGRQRREDG
jgi:uncharacterized metal-binding protein